MSPETSNCYGSLHGTLFLLEFFTKLFDYYQYILKILRETEKKNNQNIKFGS